MSEPFVLMFLGVVLFLLTIIFLQQRKQRSFVSTLENLFQQYENKDLRFNDRLKYLSFKHKKIIIRLKSFFETRLAQSVYSPDYHELKLLDYVSEGVAVFDIQGVIAFSNKSARQILGLSEDLTSGWNLLEMLRDLELREQIRQYLEVDSKEVYSIECRLTGDRKAIVQFHKLPTDDNQKPQFLLILVDVTKRRLLEKHRREFVSNVSHEMKTPLTLIKASVETLEEDTSFKGTQKYLVDLIKHNTENLVDSIEALLLLSRLDEEGYVIPRETLNINDFLSKMFSEFEERAKAKNVILEFDALLEKSATIEASSPLLSKAIGNLLDNAIKHNSSGTKISFGCHFKENRCFFYVKDNGVGIAEEELPRIFERFYRTKSHSHHQGSGLGLSLVKNIAKAHQGEVRVNSRPAESTEFLLELPCRSH